MLRQSEAMLIWSTHVTLILGIRKLLITGKSLEPYPDDSSLVASCSIESGVLGGLSYEKIWKERE